MITPDYTTLISNKLEKDFKSTCTTYEKTGFFSFSLIYGKIVKSGSKYILIVSTTENVKTGMSFWDKANKCKFQITHVNKKYKKYPESSSYDFIYLDVCDIKYDTKKDAKKK